MYKTSLTCITIMQDILMTFLTHISHY